jgi:hypothetical protein
MRINKFVKKENKLLIKINNLCDNFYKVNFITMLLD